MLTVIDPNTSAEVTVTQTIVIEDCDFYRYGVITSPDEEEVVSGDVDLAAYLVDKDWDDDVQWAVRKDTCAPNTNTIYGNVDGFNDDYDWVNNEDFTSSTSTLSWMDGHYCFVFNPTESQDDTPVRETRWFKVFNAVPDFNYSYGEDVCIEGDGSAEVIFSNETTGTEGEYDFVWDFGDGSTSTEENPTHNYNATGTFEVTLSVHLQDSSAVATTSQMINILECEEEPFERYAEITSPDPNEVISGDLNLAAFLVDKDWDDDVQWAVRKDTCAPNTNTVYGNVDGFNDDYDWVDNRDFTSSTSTLSWLDGDYCFVFNPTESHDDISIRETRWFTIDNGPSEVNDPPVVNIEEPEDGDVLSGSVDIFGSVYEDVELSHYNISIYPGGSDFNDFSQRIHSQTVSTSTGFNNQLIYTWDTSQESDGDYIIRLAARDNQGNRDLSCDPYVGNVCSHHVIEVSVDNTDQIDGDSLGASFTHNYDLQCIEGDSSVDEDIVFSSNVSGGDMPYTYLWDFGDGATSTAENPTHTYTATGTYDVVLTVTDYSEDVATTSEQIVINYCSDEGGNGDGGDGDGGEGDGGGTASGARGTTYTPFSITNTQISMQCNADGNVDMDVTWLTNRASDSRVVYDTDSYGGNNIGSAPNYGYANSTNLDPNDVTGHSVEINDLESETVYYLRSISTFGSSVVVSQEKPLTTTLDCEQPQASEPIVLGEEGAPELVLSSEFTSNYANPGSDNVGYRITVVNNGEISSYETILSSTMPTDFSFSNIDSNVHTWDLGEILPGETKVINSSVDISEDAEIMTHIATAKVYSANHGEVDDTAELEIRAIAVLADTGFDGAEFLFLFGGLISIWGLRSGLKRRKLKYNLSK